MEKFRLICGIDVSKSSLSVAIQSGEKLLEEQSYPNSEEGIERLYTRLLELESEPSQILLCLEHTGVYIEKLTHTLDGRGLYIWVANPLLIKYARVRFDRLKTDAADARKIAQFGYMMQQKATLYRLLSHTEAQIRNLYRLRSQLVKTRQQIQRYAATNLDKAVPCPQSKQIFEEMKAQLNQQIKQVEKDLEVLCQQDSQIQRTHQILRSIPGIGPVCAWHLIFSTQNFQKFDSYKQFASYAGTAPFAQQSGTSINRKPKVSRKAAKEIKTNLTMAATRQIQKNMLFYKYYHHMKIHKNKPHFWIINSIRNMLVKLAFELVEKDKTFDRQLFLKNKKSWKNILTLS